MKALTVLVQTLVGQLKNQPSTTEGKKNQQQGNAGFSGRRKIQCYGSQKFRHVVRDSLIGLVSLEITLLKTTKCWFEMTDSTATREESFKLEQVIRGGHREACLTNSGQYKKDESDNVIKSLKVTRKLPDGVYIRNEVYSYPRLFTTDTGASTIISYRGFESLRPEDRPDLVKTSKHVGATGVKIKEGPICFKTRAG